MSDERPFRFRWETTALRAGLGCGGAYFGVLMAFACYGDINGRNIWPGDERIANDLGITRTTVARYRRKAVEDGWLQVESGANAGAGKATAMRLAIPESCASGRHDPVKATAKSCASRGHESCASGDGSCASDEKSCASGQHHQPIHQPIEQPIYQPSEEVDPWALAEEAERAGTPLASAPHDTGSAAAAVSPNDAPSFEDDEPVSIAEEVAEAGFAGKVQRRKEARAAAVAQAEPSYVPRFSRPA